MEEENVLTGFVEKTGEDMEEINAMLYDIYANNSNFNALSGVLNDLEEFDNVYDLDYSLRNKVVLEDKLHGYLIYYSAVENLRYYIDSKHVNVDDIEKIKEVVRSQVEAAKGNWQWLFIETDTHKYGLLICKKNNVSLCMIYSMSQIEQKLEYAIGDHAEVFFIDNGTFLGNTGTQEEKRKLLGEIDSSGDFFGTFFDAQYFYGQRVKNSNLWVCTAVPVTLWRYMNLPQLLLLMLTICSVFLAWVLFRYLRSELLLPLSDLTETMNKIRDGEWDARIDKSTRFTEMQKVNEALEVMVMEIKKQKMLSYEQTIEKQKAQMQYLKLQLKPHFYLNGLKTLNVLSMNLETEKVQELIMKLSYHLRYLLQAEKEMVHLQAEMDYVKNFAELQENMTGRPFLINWDVQEGVSGWMVPNLCIETFVENSFKYAKLGNPGKRLVITISVDQLETEEGDFLDIRIHDNGAGYPAAVLGEINEDPVEGSKSVGINNLKRRCWLLYKDRAEYAFYNEDGAVSELVLPKQECEEYSEDISGG